jgi:hypothetical protein
MCQFSLANKLCYVTNHIETSKVTGKIAPLLVLIHLEVFFASFKSIVSNRLLHNSKFFPSSV